jgi:hypothetical protein
VDGTGSVQVVPVDQHCQVGDVLPSVGLAGDEEGTLAVFGILLEEIKQGVEVVSGCVCVIIEVAEVGVVGVSNSWRRFDEEQVRLLVPGVLILS